MSDTEPEESAEQMPPEVGSNGPEEYWDRVGLFDKPAWKDGFFLAGGLLTLAFALYRAFRAGEDGLSLTSGGIASGLIDGVIGIMFAFALFAVLPAAIRLASRKSRLKEARPTSSDRQWLPDPVNPTQERLWEADRWTDKARGVPPEPSAKWVMPVALIGSLLLIAVASIAGQAAGQPQRQQAQDLQEANVTTATAYQAMLQAVATFETSAKEAATNGGPIGLATYVMQHPTDVYDAAGNLQLTVAMSGLPADMVPTPASLTTAAERGMAYGRDLIALAGYLSSCSSGDAACYEQRFQDGDNATGRDAFTSALQAVQAQVESTPTPS